MGIMRGRIAGGVAILWHKKLGSVINVIRTQADWCIAVHLKLSNQELIILNVYTPYVCTQNEDIYMERLGFVNSFIHENQCTRVCVCV